MLSIMKSALLVAIVAGIGTAAYAGLVQKSNAESCCCGVCSCDNCTCNCGTTPCETCSTFGCCKDGSCCAK